MQSLSSVHAKHHAELVSRAHAQRATFDSAMRRLGFETERVELPVRGGVVTRIKMIRYDGTSIELIDGDVKISNIRGSCTSLKNALLDDFGQEVELFAEAARLALGGPDPEVFSPDEYLRSYYGGPDFKVPLNYYRPFRGTVFMDPAVDYDEERSRMLNILAVHYVDAVGVRTALEVLGLQAHYSREECEEKTLILCIDGSNDRLGVDMEAEDGRHIFSLQQEVDEDAKTRKVKMELLLNFTSPRDFDDIFYTCMAEELGWRVAYEMIGGEGISSFAYWD